MTITDFSIKIRQSGTISLVDVSGRLNLVRNGPSRLHLQTSEQGHKDIILNLTDLQYLDSSGIGELARVYVSVVKQSGQMKVIGLSSKIEEVLKITHLYQVFPEFPDEEAALRSFPENRPKP